MTFGEWLDTWMNLYVWPSALAKSSKMCYNRAVQAVPPELASTLMSELSPLDLRRWLLSVAVETPRAAQLDRQMLSRALTVAAKCGLCAPGLVDPDVCPQIAHKAARAAILTREQLLLYFHAAAETDVAPALMLMCCGLRRGEAMGARWCCIDLDAATLLIDGQRSRCGQAAPDPLKSEASRRMIELPAALLAVLRRWPRDVAPWVCGCSSHVLYQRHAQLLEDLRLPADVTLHGLRHSFATAAAAEGVPLKVLQRSLGHAKFQLTADLYADHLPPLSSVSTTIFKPGIANFSQKAHDWKSCVG